MTETCWKWFFFFLQKKIFHRESMANNVADYLFLQILSFILLCIKFCSMHDMNVSNITKLFPFFLSFFIYFFFFVREREMHKIHSYSVKLLQSKVKAPMSDHHLSKTEFSYAINISSLIADHSNDNWFLALSNLYLLRHSINSWAFPASSVIVCKCYILLISTMPLHMVSLCWLCSINHAEL